MSVSLLPSSPDSPVYVAWLAEIEHAESEELAEDLFRMRAEMDFYFHCRYVSSLRDYTIKEPGHPNFGKLWIEEPNLFDFCRELQADVENRVDDPFYNRSRFSFKTELAVRQLTIWETYKDPMMTTALVCWKVDGIGDKVFAAIRSEMEKNPVLLKHWPDVFWLEGETPDLMTARKLNVKRPPGPQEPTISVHGMDSLPSGLHVRRIVGSDVVTEETVKNARSIRTAVERMRLLTAIGGEDTLTRWEGTIWHPQDPWIQLLEEGFFTKHHVMPAFSGVDMYHTNEELIGSGTPNLHTKDFWAKWVRKLGFTLSACQLQQRPLARGDREFDLAWLNRAEYQDTPERVRQGLNVYFIIDQAGESDASDEFVIRVEGLGADKHYRALDLWKERGLKMEELYALMFGPDETTEMPSWIPPGWGMGLLEKWRPRGVYVEEYSTGIFGALRVEMSRRAFNFPLRKLPTIKKRSKEGRIMLARLQYQRGEFMYPADGFGHGSKHDKSDTYQQFRREEYAVWVNDPDSNLADGCLDSKAWMVQPETKHLFSFPRRVEQEKPTARTLEEMLAKMPAQGALMKPPSPWAA